MLGWILGSVVMAIIAGFLGFSDVVIPSAVANRILGILFLLLSLLSLVCSVMHRQSQNNKKKPKVRHLRLVPRLVEPVYVVDKEDLTSQEEKRL
jgi:uncharacterized membrane protein YtjA (UPF0391 family)